MQGVLELDAYSAFMVNHNHMVSQFVALTKKLAASCSKSPQTEVWKCNDGKENKEGIVEDTTEEANYMGDYKRGNPFSNIYNNARKNHHNMKWSNNFLNQTQAPPPN